jgi:hypothetical protein
MSELEQKIEAAELLHTELCSQEEKLDPSIRLQIKKAIRSYFDLNRYLICLYKEKEKIQNNLKTFQDGGRSRMLTIFALIGVSLVEMVIDILAPISHWGIVFLGFAVYLADLIRSENRELWNLKKLDDINSGIDQATIQLKQLLLEDRGISSVGDVNLDRLSDAYWARRKVEQDDIWGENNSNDEILKSKLNEFEFENELRESIFWMYGIKPVYIYDGKVYAGD